MIRHDKGLWCQATSPANTAPTTEAPTDDTGEKCHKGSRKTRIQRRIQKGDSHIISIKAKLIARALKKRGFHIKLSPSWIRYNVRGPLCFAHPPWVHTSQDASPINAYNTVQACTQHYLVRLQLQVNVTCPPRDYSARSLEAQGKVL